MKKVVTEVKIGSLGVVDISIPLIKIGEGPHKVLLLVGVHGDELSGLLVVNRLLEKFNSDSVELSIITAANPLAQALGQRQSPLDLKDLNRSFPGDTNDSITSRIAVKIFEIAKRCDVVIDLHTFSNFAPITAIFMNSGSDNVKSESLKLIKTFGPEIVWQLSPILKEERHFSGALGPRLAEAGVPNFGIEMPEHFRISEKQIEKISDGLISIFENKVPRKSVIPIFERRVIKSNKVGMFLPSKKLLDEVRADEEIGEILSIKDLGKGRVKTPFSGPLIEVAGTSLANLGDTLFTIGKRVGTL